MSNIYRTSFRPEQLPAVSKTAYSKFHHDITKRLANWEASLPSYLQYSTVNLDRSMHEGFSSTFVTMHTLFHTTQIKLNRFHRPSDVPPLQLERNISKAYTSARQLLAIADTLAESSTPRQQHPGKPIEIPAAKTKFSNPFVGYALVSAVDLISAKGRRSEIPQLLKSFDGTKTVLSQLERYWHSARTASRLVDKRVEELEVLVGWDEERRQSVGVGAIPGPGAGASARGGVWEMEDSIDRSALSSTGIDGVFQASWEIWSSAMEACKTDCC